MFGSVAMDRRTPFGTERPSLSLSMKSQSPDGLLIYSEKGCEEIALPKDKSPRDLVIAEFADAIAGKSTTHSGRSATAPKTRSGAPTSCRSN